MRTISFRTLVIISSVLLLMIFCGMTFYSLNERQQLFEQQLQRKAVSLQQSFELTLREQENKMVLLASMVAADPVVEELFHYGERMLQSEGQSLIGDDTARLRRALFERVAPAWQKMQEQHALRQLHFHLPPATSFLRIHAPDRFGDDLAALRPIITNTNELKTPQTGFEIGRIYSGIRGVVPVWYTRQDGTRTHIGSLEAGASADSLLNRLAPALNTELALLLNEENIEQAVWDEYKPEPVSSCRCYIEATTSDQIKTLLGLKAFALNEQSQKTVARMLTWDHNIYSLVSFPLYDYAGTVSPVAQPPVGYIIGWQDISAAWQSEQHSQLLLILVIAGAYLLTQLLLLLLLRRLRALMQTHVNAASAEADEAHRQLNSLLSDSPVVTYSVRLPGTALSYISPNCTRLLGYKPDDIMSDSCWWLDQIHPADREAVIQTMDWTEWSPKGIRRRYRMRHNNGQWRWIEDRCRSTLSTEGHRMLNGVLLDVTAQHRAEAALKDNEQSLRRAQKIGAVGSWEYHFADHSLTWSEETYRIFSLTLDQVPDYPLFLSRVHPEDRELVKSSWQAAIQGEPYDLEHRVQIGSEVRWVREMADFEHDETGILRATGMVQDITNQKLREQELHHLATSDTLTGLANRRHFMEQLEQERARTERFGTHCGLMMVDLDHFKQVNDHFGHATGDQVLKAFAETATSQLRQIDTIGRIGGEEFAVLLPGTDLEGARILAERLRLAIAGIRLADVEGLEITTSIGVTVIDATDSEVDAPLGRADKAVYAAKHNGRNRTETGDL